VNRRLSSAFIWAIFITGLLAIYLFLLANQGIQLILTGEVIAVLMGAALLVLPPVATGSVAAEWLFATRVRGLEKRVNQEQTWPDFEFELRPSGRPTRASADREFARFAQVAEQHPADWHSWFNLGLAYDAAGDRRRARAAMRKAVALARFETKTTALKRR
jgi:tetratricopeptide (TPR) repeat protein